MIQFMLYLTFFPTQQLGMRFLSMELWTRRELKSKSLKISWLVVKTNFILVGHVVQNY